MTSRRAVVVDHVNPPGATLRRMLVERGWKQVDLCRRLSASSTYVSDLMVGRRSFSAQVALRLEAVFGGDPPAAYWMDLQRDWELAVARREMADELARIRKATL